MNFFIQILYSIQDNYFSNWTRGIELIKSENNSIKNNSFVRNNLGVFLSDDDVNFIFEDNYFFENGEDFKTGSKPPVIKVPSFEITILIVVAFVVLSVFFLKPKKY
ncbi:MAG: right-handed parallel beta-helix repeat-containing protein [Thermoplasmatales archaeon]|nr:MAG: right-handed parallel beta-helix repeat-containing protein [Thermoplasmatales archaeon]